MMGKNEFERKGANFPIYLSRVIPIFLWETEDHHHVRRRQTNCQNWRWPYDIIGFPWDATCVSRREITKGKEKVSRQFIIRLIISMLLCYLSFSICFT
jgi:hypothetical protein